MTALKKRNTRSAKAMTVRQESFSMATKGGKASSDAMMAHRHVRSVAEFKEPESIYLVVPIETQSIDRH